MTDHWLQTGPGFWNIRGSLKIAKLLDVGTQMSVVQRASRSFVLLDSYAPDAATRKWLLDLTDGGRAVEAILNLHPFHTLHVEAVAALFPHAKLYGTTRHVARCPHLPWQNPRTEHAAIGEHFPELRFSVPRGVDFVPSNERLHFASVLAYHERSKTLHVDDTFTWLDLPFVRGLRLHPSLPKVLQARPGAVAEFRAWLAELRPLFAETRTLCTAHMRSLPPNDVSASSHLDAAVRKAEKVLAKHERTFG